MVGLRFSRGRDQRLRYTGQQQQPWTARAGTPLQPAAARLPVALHRPRRRSPCRFTLLVAAILPGCARRVSISCLDPPRLPAAFLTFNCSLQKADKFGKQVWLVDARDKVRTNAGLTVGRVATLFAQHSIVRDVCQYDRSWGGSQQKLLECSLVTQPACNRSAPTAPSQ